MESVCVCMIRNTTKISGTGMCKVKKVDFIIHKEILKINMLTSIITERFI